jgi:hypothetical protein
VGLREFQCNTNPLQNDEIGRNTMKKLTFACAAILAMNVASAADREISDLAYTKYRILSQGPFMLEGEGTSVITINPPMAITIGAKGPAIVDLISKGRLNNCTKYNPEDEANMKNAAVKLLGMAGQLKMVVAMGAQLTSDQATRL